MKKIINNIDRFETFKEIDYILYNGCAPSYDKPGIEYCRKYTGLDSYVGTSDYGHDIWC